MPEFKIFKLSLDNKQKTGKICLFVTYDYHLKDDENAIGNFLNNGMGNKM